MPSRLRRVEQVFEITLVLARVPWMPRIELLEGDNQGCPFGSDAQVDGLGAHEPRTVQVLYYRTARNRQTVQGNVEAGDACRDQALHDLAHGRVLSRLRPQRLRRRGCGGAGGRSPTRRRPGRRLCPRSTAGG